MSTVDSRIVTMKFDNAQFESGAHKTIGTLDKLKASLNLNGATKGLDNVQKAADGVSFGHIQGGITKVSAGFAAMATVAITALSTITQRAMSAGASLVKSLTLKPIMDGFREYEVKMGSIQTILANTEKDGTKLKDVNAALDELNEYADKTIYSFGEMTKTIGLFTNAGIGIEDATSMIKGFSNAAAASGATAEGTARAQYQLSQALTTGTIRLMDWKSLTNAGMGNKNMQTGLIDIANAMGTFEGTSITAKDAADNFNASLEKEWLTADVMKNYLKIMAGEVTPAQITAMGLTEEQTKLLLQQAKTAEEAATKVRTFTKLMETVGEAIGSSWSETFGIVLGNFDEATELFTDINNGISDIVTKSSEARNKVLQEWKDKGGRDTLIDALHNTVKAIGAIITPIKEAFREIFPAKTGQDLYDLTVKFEEFTSKLKIGSDTGKALKATFEGIFAVFSIVKQIVSGVIGVIFDLVGAVSKGSGSFLDITAKIGEFLVGVDSALKNGDGLTNFFNGLSAILQAPIKFLTSLAGLFAGLFKNFDSDAANSISGAFSNMGDRMGPLETLFKAVGNAIASIADKMINASTHFGPFIEAVKNVFVDLSNALASVFSGDGFDKILDLINTGLFAGILLAFRKFADGLKLDFGQGGLIDSISGSFDGLTDTLSAMQANIKADTLLKIAGAVGVLTASIVAMSMIDSKQLTVAMAGITGAFVQLLGAMTIMTTVTTSVGFLKIPILSTSLILLSTAMLLMSIAVKSLSELSWNELATGLTGVGASLAILIVSLQPLTKASSGLISTGAGVLALALGLNLMALAVKQFAGMDWASMGQGLAGVGASLVGIAKSMSLMPLNLPVIATGLLLISVSLNAISSAVVKMGELSFGDMIQGLVGLAGALFGIGKMMDQMPDDMLLKAGSLLVLSFAIKMIADSVETLGSLTLEEMVQGFIGLAAALTTLGVALHFIQGSVMGALAIAALAGALALLVPSLIALGNISIGTLAISLGALAAVFVLLGGAAYILAPLSPVILALAASIALLGAGIGMAGAGVLAFATGLSILVGIGGAVATVIMTVVNVIVQSIPKLMQSFAEGIVEFTKTIVESAPRFVDATITMIHGIMEAIRETAPDIIQTMSDLLQRLLEAVVENSPKITAAAYDLLIAFLNELSENIYQITTIGHDIVIKFMEAVGDKFPELSDKAAKMIIKFVNATADAVRENSEEMGKAGGNLASAIIEGFILGIKEYVKTLQTTMTNLGATALNAIKAFLGINSPSTKFITIGREIVNGLIQGITNGAKSVLTSVENLGIALLTKIKNVLKISSPSKEFENVGQFVSLGLAKGIEDNSAAPIKAVDNLAENMIRTFRNKFKKYKLAPAAGQVIYEPMIKTNFADYYTPNVPSKVLSDQDFEKIEENKKLQALQESQQEELEQIEIRRQILEKRLLENSIKLREADEDSTDIYIEYVDKDGVFRQENEYQFLMRIKEALEEEGNKIDLDEDKIRLKYFDQGLKIQTMPDLSSTPVQLAQDVSNQQTESSELANSQRLEIINLQKETERLVRDMLKELVSANSKPRLLNFEQNNYSPKELSAAEIYQNTQNQLARAKEELG